MTWLPTIPDAFVRVVLWVPWVDLAKGLLIGIPVAILAVGGLSWLLDWTAGRHAVAGPVCDQCELVVDEVKPYEFAGPGKHSPRLVCDVCAFRLIAADLQAGETPGFGRHADEALALVREADDACPAVFPPEPYVDAYHPAGSCHLCAEPPDLTVAKAYAEPYDVDAEFQANRAPRKDATS